MLACSAHEAECIHPLDQSQRQAYPLTQIYIDHLESMRGCSGRAR